MSKFKVGDKVRVRTFKIRPEHWNDYGKMDKWMGKDVTISDFFPPDSYVIAEAKGENSGMGWWFSERDFIRVDQREFIVIRRDGNEVIASHKYGDEIVKTARAKCSPADEFDFGKGAALAFDRLMGREEPIKCKYGYLAFNGRCMASDEYIQRVPSYQCIREKCKAYSGYKPEEEPKPSAAPPAPKFKVGDRVVHKVFGLGTIRKIDKWCGYDIHEIALDNGSCWEAVTETLSPAPEPKYYTGKVVCAGVTEKALKYFSPDSWVIKKYLERVGKIYSFVDGECLKLSHCEPFSGIKQIRKQFDGNLWFEVKD